MRNLISDSMKSFYFIIIVSSFLACGTMQKGDRISRHHDLFNRFSKTKIKAMSNWKMGDDILILRKNKTFRYYSKVVGIVNSGYYSGTYELNDTIISFKFFNNYRPSFFKSDTLLFAKKEDYQILKNTDSSSYLVVN
jgi:hypothetical protein